MARLHPQLEKDCLLIGHFPLCHLLLMRDANYPWLILVPDREDINEIFQLSKSDQQQLMQESSILASVLVEQFQADKINIAALGNVVPQLHIHHIVRYKDDAAWPAPVWGAVATREYTEKGLVQIIKKLKQGLAGQCSFKI
ncbi:MAG TPA: HIT domain-containing protein [Acidiferrobacteraceae bacterium]|jgi:diadenosine tetraphosphate (Ap4A) HIT family hydrolase|nr:HIT domain-containing protein [Acidiferrobacteraceae bacterium]HEX19601.1 HIT domain-containing protein [Acidiferrobacteraceae bacterium]